MKIKEDLELVWPHLSRKRRIQIYGLIGLMIIGAGAELVSLGAVVPFVSILSSSESNSQNEFINGVFGIFGVPSSIHAVAISVIFAVLVIVSTALRLVLLWSTNKIVFGIGHDIGEGVFSSTLNRPYSWHISKNSSEILGGLNKIQIFVQGYILPLLSALVAMVISLGLIIVLISIDPFVALFASGTFALSYFAVALGVRRQVAKNGIVIARATNERLKSMQEGIGSIRDIILECSQKVYIDRFSKIEESLRNAQAKNSFLSGSPRLAVEGIGLVMISGFALVASRGGELNGLLPSLAALGFGAQKLMPLVQTIYSSWNSITANRQSLRDVLDLLDNTNRPKPTERLNFSDAIRLDQIHYCYARDSDRAALSGITLQIRKGDVIGVVGKTGSGKSTLVDLLMGLINPTSGRFYVDNNQLRTEEEQRRWSLGVAHVPQTIYLADCSVAQNIALGSDINVVDMQRVEEAAIAAEIHEFIINLPHGYDTHVGERGIRFSGGQRQRIGIARALYRKSQFLVLDEATSALDDNTERAVIKNIHKLNSELTIVMVAHRLSTLKNCKSIITLDKGTIVEIKNPETLQI